MESEDLASVESHAEPEIDPDVSCGANICLLLVRDDDAAVDGSWRYLLVGEDTVLVPVVIRNGSGASLFQGGERGLLPALVVLVALCRVRASSWASRSSLA